MRTAEKILREQYNCLSGDRQDLQIELSLNCNLKLIEDIINEARREAIIEASEAATSDWITYGKNMGHAVDKQSIINLLKQLK